MAVFLTGATKVNMADVRLFNRIERRVNQVDLFCKWQPDFQAYLTSSKIRDAKETQTFHVAGPGAREISRLEDMELKVHRKWYVWSGEDWHWENCKGCGAPALAVHSTSPGRC